ncbi:DUF3365 domain-containing protein [Pokkaliibacter sp. CJK22405]|uniref:c-type heme family protein n=1 Tax=Pokkaliibacter sp. CJK22405 TaxID=3384615 RepID=UPI003984B7EA
MKTPPKLALLFSGPRFAAVIILLMVMSLLLVWGDYQQRLARVQKEAIQQADDYLDLLIQIRGFYSREVIPKAEKAGMVIGDEYRQDDNTLPLPNVFTRLLARQLMEENTGLRIRMYSDIPLLNGQGSQPQDEFESDSLRAVNSNAFSPYYLFDYRHDQLTLSYARADLLSPSCISCHNASPQTNKHDWKAGDVRGAMAVSRTFGPNSVPNLLLSYSALQSLIIIALLGVFWLVVTRLQRALYQSEATNDRTQSINQQLQLQVMQREEAEQELRLTASKTSAIIHSIADCLMLVDQQWRIQQSNPAGLQLLRSQWENLRMQPLSDFIPTLNTPPDQWLTSNSAPIEFEIVREDGTSFPILAQITRVADAKPSLYVVVARDVSEQRALEQTLSEARDQALASSQIKSEFLRKMEQLNSELELRVAERTEALQAANAQLQQTAAELETERHSQQQLIHQWQSAQSRLLHQEKMIALGQLTSGLVAEVHAPLALSQLLLDRERQSDEHPSEYLRDLHQSLTDIERCVHDLQKLAEAEPGSYVPVELNGLITQVLKALAPTLNGRLSLETDFHPLPPYMANIMPLSKLLVGILIFSAEQLEGIEPKHWKLITRTLEEGTMQQIEISLCAPFLPLLPQWQPCLLDSFGLNDKVKSIQASAGATIEIAQRSSGELCGIRLLINNPETPVSQ